LKRHPNILASTNAILLVIDVQEAFRKYIPDFNELTKGIVTLVEGAKLLDVPVVVTEQYSKGLGHTVEEIAGVLQSHETFEKNCFSCCGSESFMNYLGKSGRRQIIVAGIEAHVCVNQTVHDLIAHDYQVHLVVDAISSRYAGNKKIGVKKMLSAGAVPSTVEMALFEMLVNSGTDAFKAVQKLVK